MLLAAGLVSLALAPPQVLTGVEARRACSSAGKLCAQAILAAKEPTETAILANALSHDLSDRLSGTLRLSVEDDEVADWLRGRRSLHARGSRHAQTRRGLTWITKSQSASAVVSCGVTSVPATRAR